MKPQPTKPTTISTLCLRAADVIREKGWHRGGLRDPDTGAVCLMGALLTAAGAYFDNGIGPYDGQLYCRADSAVERHLGHSIPVWNDAHNRKAEDVIKVLEDVAWEHAREGEFARAA